MKRLWKELMLRSRIQTLNNYSKSISLYAICTKVNFHLKCGGFPPHYFFKFLKFTVDFFDRLLYTVYATVKQHGISSGLI